LRPNWNVTFYRAYRTLKIHPDRLADAFVKEYELNTTPKVLFPFLSTTAGLEDWFADRAKATQEGVIFFEWDGADHLGVIDTIKLNKSVRYCFLQDAAEAHLVQERQHQFPFIEFSIVPGNFSQSVFLRVTDLTESSSEDIEETWDFLISTLKERIGG